MLALLTLVLMSVFAFSSLHVSFPRWLWIAVSCWLLVELVFGDGLNGKT